MGEETKVKPISRRRFLIGAVAASVLAGCEPLDILSPTDVEDLRKRFDRSGVLPTSVEGVYFNLLASEVTEVQGPEHGQLYLFGSIATNQLQWRYNTGLNFDEHSDRVNGLSAILVTGGHVFPTTNVGGESTDSPSRGITYGERGMLVLGGDAQDYWTEILRTQRDAGTGQTVDVYILANNQPYLHLHSTLTDGANVEETNH